MIHYSIMGALLGLSAGFAPGPLSTLVMSETIRHDIRAGIKVALAPLITDPPIIVLSVFVLSRLSGFDEILGMVSMVGGSLVFFMGIKSMQVRAGALGEETVKSRSLLKGILVNFLSPHPYLFWLSVGAPAVTKAAQSTGIFAAIGYLTGFYLMLVGAKIGMAVMVGKFKTILHGNYYLYTMRFLGFMLCVLAMFLFKDGFQLLGVM